MNTAWTAPDALSGRCSASRTGAGSRTASADGIDVGVVSYPRRAAIQASVRTIVPPIITTAGLPLVGHGRDIGPSRRAIESYDPGSTYVFSSCVRAAPPRTRPRALRMGEARRRSPPRRDRPRAEREARGRRASRPPRRRSGAAMARGTGSAARDADAWAEARSCARQPPLPDARDRLQAREPRAQRLLAQPGEPIRVAAILAVETLDQSASLEPRDRAVERPRPEPDAGDTCSMSSVIA